MELSPSLVDDKKGHSFRYGVECIAILGVGEFGVSRIFAILRNTKIGLASSIVSNSLC